MFELYITDAGEVLRTGSGRRRGRRELPLFGLTSAFIRACPTIQPDGEWPGVGDVYRGLVRFHIAALEGTPEQPDPPEGLLQGMAWLEQFNRLLMHPWGNMRDVEEAQLYAIAESNALRNAVTDWLTPRRRTEQARSYLTPRQLFLSLTTQFPEGVRDLTRFFNNNERYAALASGQADVVQSDWWTYVDGLFRARTRQVGVELLVTEERGSPALAHLYSSEGLIPLAWAEIMWAIDSGTYAHTCDICGGVFRLRRPFTRTAYTCSPQCARKRKIERMGGPEAFRAYNREAQRRFAERRRRRKERTQNAEEES